MLLFKYLHSSADLSNVLNNKKYFGLKPEEIVQYMNLILLLDLILKIWYGNKLIRTWISTGLNFKYFQINKINMYYLIEMEIFYIL